MTPDAQRIAIAKALGKDTAAFRFFWKSPWKSKWEESPHYIFEEEAESARERESEQWNNQTKPVEKIESAENIPGYPRDLNAMREAWLALDEQRQWEFGAELDGVVLRACPHLAEDEFRLAALALNATAAQRAEAFLRTLNLWTET